MSAGLRVPFNSLLPGDDRADLDAAIARVIDRGWFVLGPEVERFEAEFAAATGAAHAVGVNTGTNALALAVRALDIGAGDEVITTPLSAAYTALAIMMAGARPVFADVDPRRLTLDPEAAAAAVTPRTRAIMPVHLYGQPADMPGIMAVAARHGLAVIEDAAQAHLATCDGRPVGSFGAITCYSFYPTKNLGALGDGGAITTGDAAVAERVKRLRNGGQRTRYQHDEPGINSRLDEMQAAILRARLPSLDRENGRRREIVARYATGIRNPAIRAPQVPGEDDVAHLAVVRCEGRDRLRDDLRARGIGCDIHYPIPDHRQPVFDAEPARTPLLPSALPVTERACGEVLSLPCFPAMTDAEADAVVDACNAWRA
jgi:dTDP-4-amino-4,6-dideoxygalactose transaminase